MKKIILFLSLLIVIFSCSTTTLYHVEGEHRIQAIRSGGEGYEWVKQFKENGKIRYATYLKGDILILDEDLNIIRRHKKEKFEEIMREIKRKYREPIKSTNIKRTNFYDDFSDDLF